jgi:hypothetical protein
MTLLVQSATLHVVPTHRLRHRSHMEARVRPGNDLQTMAMRSCMFPHRQREGDCDRLDARTAMYVCFLSRLPARQLHLHNQHGSQGYIPDVAKVRGSSRLDTHELREYQACYRAYHDRIC